MKAAAKKPKATPSPVPAEVKPKPREAMGQRTMPAALALVPPLAFFAVYFLCLWKWVDVRLIYHGGGQLQDFPSFYWGWDFAREFRTRPGGLVEYGAALLAQALYSSEWGALVLTGQAALVWFSLRNCLATLGANWLRGLAFLPPLLSLAIYCRYRHYSAAVASFTVAVVALWVWLRFGARRPRWAPATGLLLAGLLYTAAPSALPVFLPGALLFAWYYLESRVMALLWLGLCCLVPPIAGRALFGFAPGEAYAKLLPLAWDPVRLRMSGVSIVFALYLLVPLLSVGALLYKMVRSAKHATTKVAGEPPKAAASAEEPARSAGGVRRIPATLSRPSARAMATMGLVLVPLAVVWATLNPRMKAFLRVDYLAWHGRWREVFAAAKANPQNPFIACAVAQASYHTGTLTGELPALASPADLLLFSDKTQSHWKKSDLYFDLGYLNMALHHLTESMEYYGERPILLQRLALVNLALTNLSTAEVYLGTLARAPFHGRWARDYLERIKLDPTLAGDPEVSRLRRCMVRRDSVLSLSADEELLMLLNANRQNRMAFEYLMTYYLLTKNLQAFVKNITRVRDFTGFPISTQWDEALLLASAESGQPVEVPGHVIGYEARRRVTTVLRVVEQHGNNAAASRRELAPDYAQTYSFYWCFDR